jgi:hypothetical protein
LPKGALTQTWKAAARDVHAQATTGGAAPPRLDKSWVRLRRISGHMTGFVATAPPRVLDLCTEISCRWDTGGDSHRQIMAKHGTLSDHCFPDFQRACTKRGGRAAKVGSACNLFPLAKSGEWKEPLPGLVCLTMHPNDATASSLFGTLLTQLPCSMTPSAALTKGRPLRQLG